MCGTTPARYLIFAKGWNIDETTAFLFWKGTPQKDVIIKSDAPDTLLLEKHADYIASYGSKKDDYVCMIFPLKNLFFKEVWQV